MQDNPPTKKQIEAMTKEFAKTLPRQNPSNIKLSQYDSCFICERIVSWKKKQVVVINGQDVIAHRACVKHVCKFQAKFPDKFIVFNAEELSKSLDKKESK